MERPWLILCRVLRVDRPGGGGDDGLHADAEEHAAVAEAEADTEEHAVVGEAQAEEHVALGAQDEQAAVGEEAEEDLQVQLLQESVVNLNTDAATSEAAHAARGAAEPDFVISVEAPSWVSSLIAGPGSHPDPDKPDMYPYIVASGRFCLLVHFAVAPSYGTNFSPYPYGGHLVVVRHFGRASDGQIAACAVRVTDRTNSILPLTSVDSVGLVCDEQTGRYQIAELILTTGFPAILVHMSSDTGVWLYSFLHLSLAMDRRRDWVPHGTVTVNSTVCWFDLSWGIISCNLTQPFLQQVLIFHRLPPGRVLRAGAGALPDLHCKRCIAVSENLVRYVEIILYHHQAATVNMWYRDLEDFPWRWKTNYRESFEDIWNDESYVQTGLPRNPPMLVGVSPVDSNVVYFSLDQRLFGVNVPEHTVVDCEELEPLDRPGRRDEPVTSRYLITWNLDPDGAINVGHHVPDQYSDHGDSSDGGPMDEGDIDYETPSE